LLLTREIEPGEKRERTDLLRKMGGRKGRIPTIAHHRLRERGGKGKKGKGKVAPIARKTSASPQRRKEKEA